ncbi:hypothetical protein CR513_00585, partial [Mucuna pruriens]
MLNGTNFKVWKEAVEIVLGCMDLDLAFRVEESIPTMDNLQEVYTQYIFSKYYLFRNDNLLSIETDSIRSRQILI